MELKHFGHPDPLVLKKNVHINQRCKICEMFIRNDSCYGCDPCRYYIHEICSELPPQISHPFHPSHPLSLLANRHALDDNNRRRRRSVTDKKTCVLRPPTTHRHMQLAMGDFIEKRRETCEACGRACSGQPTYGCEECWYFLHKPCAEIPREIDHSFHPRHPLYLRVADSEFICKLCGKGSKTGFAFKCQQCGLWLCVQCGTTLRSRAIKHRKAHEHLLYFIEELYMKIDRCSGYETYCKQRVLSGSDELTFTSPFAFRCMECDFTLHLLCGPLPRTIKHDCHVHPLALVDFVVEDGYDEHYCDVCETERNPRICVYYCEECKLTAHVNCGASEIVKVLKGDSTDHVELKTVGEDEFDDDDDIEDQGKPVMTLKDVINKLTEDERKTFGWHYKWDDSTSHDNTPATTQSDLTEKDTERTLKLSRFTRSAFDEFLLEMFHCFRYSNLEVKPSDLELKIVKVKDHMIPQNLASVLRKILREYGDVSDYASSSLKEWNCVMYFLLCQVVKQISNAKVGDVTRDQLREWFHHLQFLKSWGRFRVSFACASLDSLMYAFLGAQSERLEQEIPTRINKEIEELQNKIAELQQKIEEKKVGLEICKEYRGASPKSEFMEECVKKASELKWKDASHELFSHPNQTDHGLWFW